MYSQHLDPPSWCIQCLHDVPWGFNCTNMREAWTFLFEQIDVSLNYFSIYQYFLRAIWLTEFIQTKYPSFRRIIIYNSLALKWQRNNIYIKQWENRIYIQTGDYESRNDYPYHLRSIFTALNLHIAQQVDWMLNIIIFSLTLTVYLVETIND